MEWRNERISENESFLTMLLQAPCAGFGDDLTRVLPREHGLYAITSTNGEFLHAGKSDKGKNGLWGRIWEQHYRVGGSSGDLVEKVRKRHALNRRDARLWIEHNCKVQWIVLEDRVSRGWAEHYILSVLRPSWCS